MIKLKDIRSIQKVKIAKFIPNAITITVDNDKYLFTTFASRDKTYTTLFRMWQSAIYEQVYVYYYAKITKITYIY